MPIYLYRCQECDRNFEVLQKISDGPVECCEVCGGDVIRVISPAGIIFKGPGFYKTDYGTGNNGKTKAPVSEPKESSSTPPCASGSCGNACPSAS